jgi:hypothetical protein
MICMIEGFEGLKENSKRIYSTLPSSFLRATDKKEKKKPPLRIFENFCNRTLHTFAKPHKPA